MHASNDDDADALMKLVKYLPHHHHAQCCVTQRHARSMWVVLCVLYHCHFIFIFKHVEEIKRCCIHTCIITLSIHMCRTPVHSVCLQLCFDVKLLMHSTSFALFSDIDSGDLHTRAIESMQNADAENRRTVSATVGFNRRV